MASRVSALLIFMTSVSNVSMGLFLHFPMVCALLSPDYEWVPCPQVPLIGLVRTVHKATMSWAYYLYCRSPKNQSWRIVAIPYWWFAIRIFGGHDELICQFMFGICFVLQLYRCPFGPWIGGMIGRWPHKKK